MCENSIIVDKISNCYTINRNKLVTYESIKLRDGIKIKNHVGESMVTRFVVLLCLATYQVQSRDTLYRWGIMNYCYKKSNKI